MISVIIPTYNSPESLDLCLLSAINGQDKKNQIIVVVDGTFDINQKVLSKYSSDIELLNLEENVGTCKATNLGVFNSKYDKILIVNDDNVFPKNWDTRLLEIYEPNSIIAPNQIEPCPSIFPQFDIKDLGRNPSTFDLDLYWDYCSSISKQLNDETGSTFPIFTSKLDFLKIGGFDITYPSPSGFVADWELFLKAQLNGLKMIRTYWVHFYHFVSLTTKTPEQEEKSRQYELNCHEYAKYKWGSYIKHNPQNNLKYI